MSWLTDDGPWYDRQGRRINAIEWAQLHADHDYLAVKQETIGNYLVSTVWIGIDMNFAGHGPPIIYETMCFDLENDREDVYLDRYPTEAAALAGHDQAVAWVRDHARTAPPAGD